MRDALAGRRLPGATRLAHGSVARHRAHGVARVGGTRSMGLIALSVAVTLCGCGAECALPTSPPAAPQIAPAPPVDTLTHDDRE